MGDDEYSDFGFINSALVFLVSVGLTLVLLWIVSRIIGQPWFENLPDWLTSGLGKILVGLFSGGSLAAIVIKKLASRHSPNFFYRICGTTLGLFIVILLLVFILRQHQNSAQSPSLVPNPSVGKTQPPPPAPKKELYTTDENGQDYLERWNARGSCREATQDDRHQCILTNTRRHIGESKDPFGHWKLMLKSPGPPYEVICEPGGWELKENDTPGPGPGEIEGNWAICSGWINGGEDPIQMTVKYQMLR